MHLFEFDTLLTSVTRKRLALLLWVLVVVIELKTARAIECSSCGLTSYLESRPECEAYLGTCMMHVSEIPRVSHPT